jgi:hypothetical protein
VLFTGFDHARLIYRHILSGTMSIDTDDANDDDPGPAGVEFVHEDDGRVTARHVESGVASFGDTETEALRQLADALESHFGEGEAIDDPEAYLEEMGIDVEIGSEGSPPWLE